MNTTPRAIDASILKKNLTGLGRQRNGADQLARPETVATQLQRRLALSDYLQATFVSIRLPTSLIVNLGA